MSSPLTPVNPNPAHDATVRWLERAVIGLNLCPFAKAPHIKGRIHIAVCESTDDGQCLDALSDELQALVGMSATKRETTLLVLPNAWSDFLDFNDRLADADQILEDLDLVGVIQIASFHPHYQFAGTAPDDITNYTNRSPYPVLHLLREDSIDQADQAFPQPEAIFEANMRTLRELGPEGWGALGIRSSS
ncbi:MAG: DUF1415 domain-containing protein [Alphaproteobacteria bacterium]|nr:DUF1415 domain-containing protein [Alphaproteobacteria bacterium]MDI9329847.1 DUF1415 domain-containing protein [Alphaproteobacteria bacterium]